MEKASSVSQVNRYIKNLFIQDYALNRISVEGEVSNCKYHSSGHIYFTLKDQTSSLACVMFASQRNGLDFQLQEGQSVVVQGGISVYERDGRYQLYARKITQDGIGRLYEEYEKLKKRLLAEGLFDAHRKKKIPAYAMKIGVVTAETGAVIRDICNVSYRRNPYVQIVLYPAKVQGEDAAQTVIRGIHYFEHSDVDTIIIGRGGGSIEDLWTFNEESLARVIADCSKPIISAVGHETDTTIADYVADLRAPTPSAAAELAVYDYSDLQDSLHRARQVLTRQMESQLKLRQMRLIQYLTILQHHSPQDQIQQKRLQLADAQDQLRRMLEQKLTSARHQMELYIEELKGLSPLYKLQGGYAYVANEAGNNIQSVGQLQKGQILQLDFKDGKAEVAVQNVKQGDRKKNG